jgi:hypothetical protein
LLKAFGHPGIPLYRATGEEFLCSTCTYHADDTCNFPQRPDARECTLYHPQGSKKLLTLSYKLNLRHRLQGWLKHNAAWIVLVGLVVVSLLLALSNS